MRAITEVKVKKRPNLKIMETIRIQRSLSGKFATTQAGVLPDDGGTRQRGFSLIELMATIGIMAIVMAIALPAYSEWRERAAAKTATDTIVAHLKQARMVAISQNRSISVVFTADGYTVDSTGASPRLYNLSEYSSNLSLAFSVATLTFTSSGTANIESLTLTNPRGKDWSILVNTVGRVYAQ